SGETFYQQIQELPPSTLLHLDSNGEERSERYWVPRLEPATALNETDQARLVRETLIKSVELRLRADVPVAFCLSGGVDSNSLIAIAKRVLGRDVYGFTISLADRR